MKKFLACAVVFLSAAAPAAASESLTVYGFDAAQMQRFILATFDGSARMDVIEQNDAVLALAKEIPASRVEHLMPEYRVPSRDPLVPDRWEREPVDFAEERATFSFRPSRDGGLTVTMRADLVANPGMWRRERTVSRDCGDFHAYARYAQAFFTGGWGSGMDLEERNGRMYVLDVLEGSSAWNAGIREGDRIRVINKTPADSVALDYFGRKYQWSDYGKPFTVEMERPNGERWHAELSNDYIPAQTARLERFFGVSGVQPGRTREEVEASTRRWVSPEEKRARENAPAVPSSGMEFNDAGRVASVAPGSPADLAGVKPGDVIVELNLVKFGDTGAAKARETIEKRVAGGLTAILDLKRGGATVTVRVKKPAAGKK
ncbi:PDZ domain-containing protein [Pyramidobacter sp. CG50-2]|uniref:PDZ domain-containing protein n=1 Tax=Pyramidobacter sp. CG50-2 TaxID=2382160 RepID=UPI000EA3760D|nr:PDZ domain-containing protein [Pyramidobacter sp. CG50-2]RKJ77909.1 PDZ domain-containing protein [Pyramidobacter sp. CG50-2]